MNKSNYINNEDWQLVNSICTFNPEEPYLIAAIGWHETNWNTNPKSPKDYHLGFGYYKGSKILAKVKGLANQLKYAHEFIVRHFIFPVTLQSTTDFAVNHWKSSVPIAWAKSVYNQFVSITSEQTMDKQLTKNFKYSEFFCKGIEPPAEYFNNVMQCALQLQKVRDIIKKPIIITSAYRTKEYNASIGGKKASQHLTANAVDSNAVGMDIRVYLTFLVRYTNFQGFCIGTGRSPYNLIHADLRTKFWVDVYQ